MTVKFTVFNEMTVTVDMDESGGRISRAKLHLVKPGTNNLSL
jgi:hypothetical protein